MDKKQHITAIAPYKIYPAKMGGQKGIALFYQYLSALLPVTVISTKNNDTSGKPGGEFLPILGNSKLRYINLFLVFTIRKIIRKNQSTHLVIEHPYYGWLGILLQWFYKIPLIVHSHNIEALRFKSTGKWWWPILSQYEKMVHRKAAINFFITDDDRKYAINTFKLEENKCYTITYGFELSEPPSDTERTEAAKILRSTWNIKADENILLFNGTLDYQPNLDALDILLEMINPALLKQVNFKYKIIICGKNLPGQYNDLKNYSLKNIIYTGFVDDINIYFKGADIFLNPVNDGGGIKTKLVEALGSDLSVVTTQSGATGIPLEITGNKMLLTGDDDWESFTNTILKINSKEEIPQQFFDHFYWGNIAQKVAEVLKS